MSGVRFKAFADALKEAQHKKWLARVDVNRARSPAGLIECQRIYDNRSRYVEDILDAGLQFTIQ